MNMTYDEIKARFDSEWVLIDAPETDEKLNILSGEVIHHSKDRDEVNRRLLALRPTRFAVVYIGAMPEGTAIVL